MKIYTKTGDRGETGLVGGSRIAKASARISAIGDVDELNAALGIVRLYSKETQLEPILEWLQSALFDFGAELASPPGGRISFAAIDAHGAQRLEQSIDDQTANLPALKNFILPGGSSLAAHLHYARAVARRAERSVLSLHAQEPVREELMIFINRVSDWLFTAARTANMLSGTEDVPWKAAKTSG